MLIKYYNCDDKKMLWYEEILEFICENLDMIYKMLYIWDKFVLYIDFIY